MVLDPGYARHKGLQGLGFRQMAMGIKRGGTVNVTKTARELFLVSPLRLPVVLTYLNGVLNAFNEEVSSSRQTTPFGELKTS